MEYVNPVSELKNLVLKFQIIIFVLIFGIVAIAVSMPIILKKNAPILVEAESFHSVAETKPWKMASQRYEGFVKSYLHARFEWDKESFSKKKDALSPLLSEKAFLGLRDSITAFNQIAETQGGKSYFVLDSFAFAFESKIAEVKAIWVLKIREAAVSVPFFIKFTLEETAFSKKNPYGLKIKQIVESSEADFLKKGKSE